MSVRAPGTSWYNAVWRWHFYAGLFCVPFVLWLSITGTIYLWRPQIEAWLERPYDRLPVTGTPARPEAIVAAALAAVPEATLRTYQLPDAPGHAVRVVVGEKRVYVDPYDARVLGVVTDENRPLRVVFRLHGELLAGNTGSYLVEIAACWTITMLLTGLYLWWPRRPGLAGVLFPRLRQGKRLFWRDLHAVAGIWVSVAAVVLILTGLPWAKAWGNYLEAVRVETGTLDGPLDWQVGARSGQVPKADTMLGEHAGHGGHGRMAIPPVAPLHPSELDRVVERVAPLGIAPPVLVAPPKTHGLDWTVSSDAATLGSASGSTGWSAMASPCMKARCSASPTSCSVRWSPSCSPRWPYPAR